MNVPILFFTEEINFKLEKKTERKKWLLEIIKNAGKTLGFINYVFCSDDYLYKINTEKLNHNTYTDIITFQYNEINEALESDIYISIDRIKENAKTYEVSFEEELNRVLVHGILHLLGYKDKSTKEKSLMTKMENEFLVLIN